MADPVPRFLAAPTPPREVAVTRAKAFEAAHRFSDPRFGKAARLHGHNFVVTATIAGPIDPATHFLVDFRRLDELLDGAFLVLGFEAGDDGLPRKEFGEFHGVLVYWRILLKARRRVKRTKRQLPSHPVR